MYILIVTERNQRADIVKGDVTIILTPQQKENRRPNLLKMEGGENRGSNTTELESNPVYASMLYHPHHQQKEC